MYKEKILELQQFDQLHRLMALDIQYCLRLEALGSALNNAREQISGDSDISINELFELMEALPKGEKRFQMLKENKRKVRKDIDSLLYLLN